MNDPRRNKDLALIHIAKADLSLPEDAYRALVRLAAGGAQRADGGIDGGHTDSAGELTPMERRRLLAQLRERGWQPGKRVSMAKRPLRQDQAADTKEGLASKVRALLLDSERSDAYASAIARKRFGVQRWEWLPYADLERLMQMLIVDQTRRAMRAGCVALATGGDFDDALTAGEVEHGVGARALAEAARRGLIDANDALTEAGCIAAADWAGHVDHRHAAMLKNEGTA